MKTLNGVILLFVYAISIIVQGVTYYLGLHHMMSADQVSTVFSISYAIMALTALLSLTELPVFKS